MTCRPSLRHTHHSSTEGSGLPSWHGCWHPAPHESSAPTRRKTHRLCSLPLSGCQHTLHTAPVRRKTSRLPHHPVSQSSCRLRHPSPQCFRPASLVRRRKAARASARTTERPASLLLLLPRSVLCSLPPPRPVLRLSSLPRPVWSGCSQLYMGHCQPPHRQALTAHNPSDTVDLRRLQHRATPSQAAPLQLRLLCFGSRLSFHVWCL